MLSDQAVSGLALVEMGKIQVIDPSQSEQFLGINPEARFGDQAEVVGHLLADSFRPTQRPMQQIPELEGKEAHNPAPTLKNANVSERTRQPDRLSIVGRQKWTGKMRISSLEIRPRGFLRRRQILGADQAGTES